MIAESIFVIANHLPEKEMERLYMMIGKKINAKTAKKITKQKPIISNQESISYIFKNVFCKTR